MQVDLDHACRLTEVGLCNAATIGMPDALSFSRRAGAEKPFKNIASDRECSRIQRICRLMHMSQEPWIPMVHAKETKMAGTKTTKLNRRNFLLAVGAGGG